MSAGPSGSRELRMAKPAPSGNRASSTQLPLGLLRRLFCQVTPERWPAGIPLYVCSIDISLRTVGAKPTKQPASARASALASAADKAHASAYADVRGRSQFVIKT